MEDMFMVNQNPNYDVQKKLNPKAISKFDKSWSVVVFNDPINLMSYVTMIFRKTFGMNIETAKRHMLEVHKMGSSIVWKGTREQAENYSYILHQWQLNSIVKKDA